MKCHVVAYSVQMHRGGGAIYEVRLRNSVVFVVSPKLLRPLVAIPLLNPMTLSENVELAATFLGSVASWDRLDLIAQAMEDAPIISAWRNWQHIREHMLSQNVSGSQSTE